MPNRDVSTGIWDGIPQAELENAGKSSIVKVTGGVILLQGSVEVL